MNPQSANAQRLSKITKRRLSVYKIYYFSFYFGLGVFSPLFPMYMRNVARLTDDKIGIILSFGPLISIFFQPFWGFINDKFHIDKKILLTGVGIMDLSVVIIMLYHQFSLIVAGMVFYSLFSCAIGPIQDSFSIRFVRKYGYKYGDIRVFGSIGYALASVITGVLVNMYNYNMIIYLSTLSAVAAFISFFKIKKEKLKLNIPKKGGNLLQALKNPVFALFLIFASFSIGTFFAVGNYMTLKITSLGGQPTQLGVVTSLQVGMEIITMLFVTRVNKGITDFKLLLTSILLQIPVLLIYILSNNLNVVLYTLLIRGISSGLFIPVIVNFISTILKNDEISAGLTLYSALSINLVGYVITLASGFIISWVGYAPLFTVILILVLLSIVFAFMLNKKRVQTVEQL